MSIDTRHDTQALPVPVTDAAALHSAEGGGAGFLFVFAGAALAVAMAVVVAALVESWWILVPVMLFDFVATAIVTVVIARLLNDGGTAD